MCDLYPYLIRSPYNYFDLAAYTLAISGCILLLKSSPHIDEDQDMDIGPNQIPIMSFAILFLYFNIVSQPYASYPDNDCATFPSLVDQHVLFAFPLSVAVRTTCCAPIGHRGQHYLEHYSEYCLVLHNFPLHPCQLHSRIDALTPYKVVSSGLSPGSSYKWC